MKRLLIFVICISMLMTACAPKVAPAETTPAPTAAPTVSSAPVAPERTENEAAVGYFNSVSKMWKVFGYPKAFNATIDKDTAFALADADLQSVKDACKTVGDAFYYMAAAGYEGLADELRYLAQDGARTWRMGGSAKSAFETRSGSRAELCALMAELLEGDYADVGLVEWIPTNGVDHYTLLYVQVSSTHYIVDVWGMCRNKYTGTYADGRNGLEASAVHYDKQLGGVTVLMLAYPYSGKVLPIAMEDKTARVDERLFDAVQCVYAADGYSFAPAPVGDAQSRIDAIQNGEPVSREDPNAPIGRVPEAEGEPEAEGGGRTVQPEIDSAVIRAELDRLQKEISTVEEAIAHLDSDAYTPWVYSGIEGEIRFDIEHLYNLHSRSEATFHMTYTAFIAWCLADDIEGIQFIVVTGLNHGTFRSTSALAIPEGRGYRIVNPIRISKRLEGENGIVAFADPHIDSLDALKDRLICDWQGIAPIDIFVADASQTGLLFTVNENTAVTMRAKGTAELLYHTDSEELMDRLIKDAARTAETLYNRVVGKWDTFCLPDACDVTLTRAEFDALMGKDIDTVASAVRTLGDAAAYLALAGYRATDGDLDIASGDYFWSCNRSPQLVFALNEGNCGGTAGLVAYLLEGDYDEVGILSMGSPIEVGGGHVINYLKIGSTTCVVDMVGLVIEGFSRLPSWTGKNVTLSDVTAALKSEYSMIIAYRSITGDMPTMGAGYTTYLPENYRDTIEIVFEDYGYHYEWKPIDEDTLNTIERVRNEVRQGEGNVQPAKVHEMLKAEKAAWDAHAKTLRIGDYNLPAAIGNTTIDYTRAKALVGMAPGAIAKRVKTVGDVLQYMIAARFAYYAEGVYTPWYRNWGFDPAGNVQIMANYGCCCAGFVNAVNFLLAGDYEETGVIRWIGGGNHTINYVKADGKYYVFDFTKLCAGGNYDLFDTPVTVLDDLADYYASMSADWYPKNEIELLVAFESDGAAYPSDWNDPPEFDGLTFPTEAEGKVLTIYQRKANAGVKFRDVDVAIPDWKE